MGTPREPERLATLWRLGLLDAPDNAAFDRLTRLATRTLRVPVSLVSFVTEDRQVFAGAAGLPAALATRRETPLSHSFCQHEVASGEPLVVNDAREHPILCDNPAIADLGVVAYAGIPLRAPDGQVLGSFCVIDFQPRAWTGEDLQILTDLAATAMTEIELRAASREVGRAVERAGRLQTATAALAGALTLDAVTAVTIEQGVAALGAHAGLVALLTADEAMLEIVQAAGYPPHLVEAWRRIPLAAPVPLAEAVRTKAPLWFASLAELAARYPPLAAMVSGFSAVHPLTAIPLLVDERAVGVLGLAFPDARAFDAEDQALMLTLAGQCAQALERARLYEAEHQARIATEAAQGRLTFLAEASTILATSLDYETTLNNVIQLIMPTLADFGFFDVVEPDGQVRRLARAHQDPRRQAVLESTRWVRSERTDINLCALSSGLPGFHPDIDDAWLINMAAGPEHLALLRDLAFRSMITVPLLIRGERLGALTLFYADSGRRHTAGDLALAEELARRAAVAVENAQLYRREREVVQQREQFVSIASHELKTPLTSVFGFMQLLQRQLSQPAPDYERFKRYVDRCQQQLDRLRALVEDLLVASRSRQGRLDLRPELCDLAALAEEVRERCGHMPERTARHCLVLEAPAPVEGTWDRDRLDQVLSNLVSNALKYSPDGGTVLVRVARYGDEAEVVISDAGLGIPADEQASLFQPFVRASTTHEQINGTGLGLYIVRQIVEAHGGTVALESVMGEGTTVTLRLPLVVSNGTSGGTVRAVR